MDAIFNLSKTRSLYAALVQGTYYDTGSKIGWLKANVDFALTRPDLKHDFIQYLRSLSL